MTTNRKFNARIIILGCCLLFLAAGEVSAQTYYVSNCVTIGNDSNSGTSTSTPWSTVNKVNTSSFDPGDSILFNRGCVWREKLTVPSSGTAGSVITFGAYGSGANPVLNGSAVLDNASFSPYLLSDASIYSQTMTTNTADGAPRNYRQVIPSVSQAATAIKIRLTASDAADWAIAGVSIGAQSSGKTATSLTRVTWDGGNNGTTITHGTTKDSDYITFSMTTGQAYLVSIYMTARNLKQNTATGTAYYDSNAVDESQIVAPNGSQFTTTLTATNVVTAILAQGKTIYSAAQGTDPIVMWEDSVFLSEKESIAACSAAGSWYWDGADLYVNAADESNVVTNAKTYEIADLTYGIWDNGNDYLDISNIDSMQSYGSADTSAISGVYLTGAYNTVHDLASSNTRRHNFCFYNGANDNLAYNLTLHDDISTTPVCVYGAETTANTLRNSEIYNSQLNSIADGLIVIHGGAHDNIIEKNDFHIDNGAVRQIFNEYDAGTNSNIIRFNYFHGNGSYGFLVSGGTNGIVYGNLFDARDFSREAVALSGVSGWSVNGNTVIANSVVNAGIRLINSPNTTVKNNIINGQYSFRVDAGSQSGLAADYNLFYHLSGTKWTWGATDYTVFTDWKINSSQDSNSKNVDPLFTNSVSDFSLQSTSPAIDSGVSLSATYNDAIYPGSSWASSVTTADQNFRGSDWEMGAYIYPVPRAPTIGAPSAQSTSSMRWSFTDNASDETGFKLYNNADALVTSSATQGLAYLDETSLSVNTSYSGRYVRAYNGYGESVASGVAATKYTLANVPASPVLAVDSSSQITATWAANSNPAGTQYDILNITNSATSGWTTSLSWASTGLSCGGYSFKVKARNGDGVETSFSDTATTAISVCNNTGSYSNQPVYTLNYPAQEFSVKINNGDQYAASSNVTLIIKADESAVNMFVSNDLDFKDSKQEPFKETTQWTLAQGVGEKSVYVRLCNQSSYCYVVLTDTVIVQSKVSAPATPTNPNSTVLPNCDGVSFSRNLYLGIFGKDVQCLKSILNQDPSTSVAGAGTTYFGPLTRQAVARFQNKYKAEISQFAGYTISGTGIIGPGTRIQLNKLQDDL